MKKRAQFVLLILLSMVFTLVTVYILFCRFSNYTSPGGWGNVYDRGMPELSDYLVGISLYVPMLVGALLPRYVINGRYFLVVGYLCLFSAILIDGSVIWLPLAADLDEVYILSNLARALIFLSGLTVVIITVLTYGNVKKSND